MLAVMASPPLDPEHAAIIERLGLPADDPAIQADLQQLARRPAPPSSDIEPMFKTLLWALSLAAGTAGALAWAAPVVAFFWPLGFGGASIALAMAAWELRGPTPWYGWVAVVAGLFALAIGIVGYLEIEDVRTGLDVF
jgi:sterol desaturase/sphingolipid hydroxylase (fatty acid hydroxylase superfamily)